MATVTPFEADDHNLAIEDRRAALRHSVVDSRLVTVDVEFQEAALLLDLSETGMSVQLVVEPPAQETTSFRFTLPDSGERVAGVGRIAWTDASGRLGIQFENLDEASRTSLQNFFSGSVEAPVPIEPVAALPDPFAIRHKDAMTLLCRHLETRQLAADEAMALIAERICQATGATGAAIAIEHSGRIACRASSGNAPPIGALLDPQHGLSGECLRTGKVIECGDSETEPRVDPLVCRQLDLRSILIVPVLQQQRPAGVLEVFSAQPNAFDTADVLLVQHAAELVLRATQDTASVQSDIPLVPKDVLPPPPDPSTAANSAGNDVMATVRDFIRRNRAVRKRNRKQ